MAGISHFNSKYTFPHSTPVNYVPFLFWRTRSSRYQCSSLGLFLFFFSVFLLLVICVLSSSFFAMNLCLANFPGKHQFGKKTGKIFFCIQSLHVGGAVASWLVRSTPERAVRVRTLAGDIVLCSWARHFTHTVPLYTQVYKWVPTNLMLGGNPAMD